MGQTPSGAFGPQAAMRRRGPPPPALLLLLLAAGVALTLPSSSSTAAFITAEPFPTSKWDPYESAGRGLTDHRCEAAYHDLVARIADLRPLARYDRHLTSEEDLLIRFLIAHRYNVDVTERAVRRYVRWRQEYRADDALLRPRFPRAFQDKLDIDLCGSDREGNLLYVEVMDGQNLVDILHAQPFSEILRFHVFRQERERLLLRQLRSPRVSSVIDVGRIGIGAWTNRGVLAMMKRLADHDKAMYPEILRYYFVINAPPAATTFFRLVSPFLDGPTRRKVHIWGANEWRRKIAAYMDVDQLPMHLGGRNGECVAITDMQHTLHQK